MERRTSFIPAGLVSKVSSIVIKTNNTESPPNVSPALSTESPKKNNDLSHFEFHPETVSSSVYIWQLETSVGEWITYNDEDNALIERSYRLGGNEICLHNIYHIDFLKLKQTNLVTKEEKTIRQKLRNPEKLSEEPLLFIDFAAKNELIAKLVAYIQEVGFENANIGIIYHVLKLSESLPREQYLIIGLNEITDKKEIYKLYIDRLPNDMHGYASLLIMKDDSVTLKDGRNVTKSWLYSTALEKCSLSDPHPWYYLSECCDDDDKNKGLYRRNAFDLAGGTSCFHGSFDQAIDTYADYNDKEQFHKYTDQLSILLQEHDRLSKTGWNEQTFIFFPQSKEFRLKIQYRLRAAIVDLYCELCTLIDNGNCSEFLIPGVDGEPTKEKVYSTLDNFTEKFGKECLNRRIYQFNRMEEGQKTWFIFLVLSSKRFFFKALYNDEISLESYGKVLVRSNGKEAPEDIKNQTNREYGLDNENGNFNVKVDKLSKFLIGTSPHINIYDALMDLLHVDYNLLSTLEENPFLFHLSLEDLRTLHKNARTKALSAHVEGWPDGDIEPFVSYKTAIILFTMDEPYPLYRLINTPFHTRNILLRSLHYHRSFLSIFLRALSQMSDSLRFKGTVYRGVVVGRNKHLLEMIDKPEVAFEINNRLTFAAPTSASQYLQVADKFADGLLFKIEGVTGYDIRSLSYFEREMEILLPPPVMMDVVEWSRDGKNIVVTLKSASIDQQISYL